MNTISSCNQFSMSPATACPLPTPVVFELEWPICENIMPKNASGSETKQHAKNMSGDNTESIMETIPSTIPAVAEPLFCAVANTIPC